MTAANVPHEHRSSIGPEASPREIRDALLPEEAEAHFDHAWRTALDEAAASLDLTGVFKTLANWRLIAMSTQLDPERHRRMLVHAERTLRTGEQPAGTISWDQLRAQLGC